MHAQSESAHKNDNDTQPSSNSCNVKRGIYRTNIQTLSLSPCSFVKVTTSWKTLFCRVWSVCQKTFKRWSKKIKTFKNMFLLFKRSYATLVVICIKFHWRTAMVLRRHRKLATKTARAMLNWAHFHGARSSCEMSRTPQRYAVSAVISTEDWDHPSRLCARNATPGRTATRLPRATYCCAS
jgi:hypothetical protein